MDAPLAGLRVVELVLAPGELGRGMATGAAAMFLADQGADVVRVVAGAPGILDVGVAYGEVWHRGTRTAAADLATDGDVTAVRRLLQAADVALVGGSSPLVTDGPLSYGAVSPANPGLVYCQVAPNEALGGDGQDYELLAQARAGLMLLLQGRRERPVVAALEFGACGAALTAVGGILAGLVHRARRGTGLPVHTSLEDGEAALLAMLLNRASEPTKGFMMTLGLGTNMPTWLYRCADGSWLHLHPGAKGAYERIIALFGDEESEGSRWAEASSRDAARRQHERWAATVASKDRDSWLREMRAADIPVQPVLEPGDALFDHHVRAVGLAVEQPSGDGDPIVTAGTPVRVRGEDPVAPRAPAEATLGELAATWPASPPAGEGVPVPAPQDLPLDGVRILDFGHFLAGPLGDALLADLGADVIKVEPVEGDPLRLRHDHNLGSVFACAQRGKRSLAIDLKSPDAAPVIARLFAWADIVHHNFRPGAAERLGIDEVTARAANPGIVYCYSPAFGSSGPDRGLPGFDQMFQAFCGLEAAAGGEGNPPMWYGPAPVDTAGGWLSAIAMLLGHLRRLQSGAGVSVESTQLGAGLFATSGVFARAGQVVRGPRLDADQTGFGPGYRIYRCADGAWLAVVVPTERAWQQLRALDAMPGDLPARFVALRVQDDLAARELEAALVDAFGGRDAADWLAALAATDVRAEPVEQGPLERFLDLFYDRPGNDELGRVARFEQPEYGVVEQVAFAARLDGLRPRVRRRVPRIGEHSREILLELGIEPASADRLVADSVVRQAG